MWTPRRSMIWCGLLLGALVPMVFTLVANDSVLAPPPDLTAGQIVKPQLLDRHGRPLTVTYQNPRNEHARVAYHEIPALLRAAFIVSEDKRFFAHGGVDWRARLHAVWQNLKAGRVVRGASTISEQVVRILHPRPRTLWSRWLEGIEARRLEARYSKAAILEYYLNQVPYTARRRGVRMAAQYYFGRDLDTLSVRETLALAVMVRAPARLNVHTAPGVVDRALRRLARGMRAAGVLSAAQWTAVNREGFRFTAAPPTADASHFARFVYPQATAAASRVTTTLDLDIQRAGQQILDQQLRHLRRRQAANGALLVVDHRRNEVLAWVIGRAGDPPAPANAYDAVRTPRQPGSTLKPFVYALAMSRGWTPATMIDDRPLSESVGQGLHTYQNYSRRHYGPLSLREALGNSLNIPAVRAIQYVGAGDFLDTLHALGVRSLDRHPDVYGDGLALGNGAITLFELVQAYAVLARGGVFAPLQVLAEPTTDDFARRVFSPEVASLTGHILSDADARRLEFNADGILDMPVQTAVKTGTSSDYRDAWAVGYNYGYTVGVWMGNLDHRPMKAVTGSVGPALVLRSVMAELVRGAAARPLHFSRRLVQAEVCIADGRLADGDCDRREEWFVPGKLPAAPDVPSGPFRIRRPSNGLQMAMDPRIPDHLEAFEFALAPRGTVGRVEWFLDGRLLARTREARYLWSVAPGAHRLMARIWPAGKTRPLETRPVTFVVK